MLLQLCYNLGWRDGKMANRVQVPRVFKTVISPVQAWLISQSRCVGCGRELAEAKRGKGKKEVKTVTCQCGRIFIFEEKTKKYRRALLDEV